MKNYDLKLDLSKIVQTPMKKEQIMSGTYNKKQIVLHHTVSGDFPVNVMKWWNRTKTRVATAILIGHDGVAYQCYSSKKWAHHIGLKSSFLKSKGFPDYGSRNATLNKYSIGIEICNWGGLKKKGSKWYNSYDKQVSNVVEYDEKYRGYQGFERYTEKQIEKCLQLCYYWHKIYDIPMKYNESMWDVDMSALRGDKGIWTHTSFREDKSDCHPQAELIEGLKFLDNFVYGTAETNENILSQMDLDKLQKNMLEMNKILDNMEDIIQGKDNTKKFAYFEEMVRKMSIILQ